jgi:hypothetical protein
MDALDKIERKVDEIHTALVGNEFGEGIIHRVKRVEKYVEEDKKRKWYLTGFLAAVALFAHEGKKWIVNLFQ